MVYGGTYLFNNMGPNSTTYIIPGEIFPPQVRGTCHGISAASGKIGGALAGNVFPVLLALNGGTRIVCLMCAGLGLLGVIWTFLFVPSYTTEDVVEWRAKQTAAHTEGELDHALESRAHALHIPAICPAAKDSDAKVVASVQMV
eukprot:jgi/Tetstr1/438457/TSEL_027012.t1